MKSVKSTKKKTKKVFYLNSRKLLEVISKTSNLKSIYELFGKKNILKPWSFFVRTNEGIVYKIDRSYRENDKECLVLRTKDGEIISPELDKIIFCFFGNEYNPDTWK